MAVSLQIQAFSSVFPVFYTGTVVLQSSVRHLQLQFHLKAEVILQNRMFLMLQIEAEMCI